MLGHDGHPVQLHRHVDLDLRQRRDRQGAQRRRRGLRRARPSTSAASASTSCCSDYPLADAVIFAGLRRRPALLHHLGRLRRAGDGQPLLRARTTSSRTARRGCGSSWASVTGLLTVAMLAVGGILALQYATIIMGLPFAFVLVLVMWGLFRSLASEGSQGHVRRARHLRRCCRRAPARPRTTARRGRPGWRGRPTSSTTRLPTPTSPRRSSPRWWRSPTELTSMGVAAAVVPTAGAVGTEAAARGSSWPPSRTRSRFVYRVEVRRSPVPTYGGRMIGNRDQYARLEVHLVDGGQDYDVMGYTAEPGHPRLPRPVRAAPGVPPHRSDPGSADGSPQVTVCPSPLTVQVISQDPSNVRLVALGASGCDIRNNMSRARTRVPDICPTTCPAPPTSFWVCPRCARPPGCRRRAP